MSSPDKTPPNRSPSGSPVRAPSAQRSPAGSPSMRQSPIPSTSRTPVSILKSPSTSPTGRATSPAAKSPAPSSSRSPKVSILATDGSSRSPEDFTQPTFVECPSCPEGDSKESGDKFRVLKHDAVNTEYLYYSSALREVGPALTNELDRQLLIPWIRKLFRPEYHTRMLRNKRNKFLLYLTLTILNDEVFGIFRLPPPEGALPALADLEEEEFPPAEWELDEMWADALADIPDGYRYMECSVHSNEIQCAIDHDDNKFYDEEFQFLIYLARPYATLLKKSKDRTRAASWLQKLCTIQVNSCNSMKQLRNDYATALLGYLQDLRLVGPFKLFPHWQSLPPLAEVAEWSKKLPSPLHPCSEETSEFMAAQPLPNEGAFCYIAVTGELLESSLNELD